MIMVKRSARPDGRKDAPVRHRQAERRRGGLQPGHRDLRSRKKKYKTKKNGRKRAAGERPNRSLRRRGQRVVKPGAVELCSNRTVAVTRPGQTAGSWAKDEKNGQKKTRGR